MYLIYKTIQASHKNINFLKFKNIWLFLPFLSIFFYAVQSIYGLYLFEDSASRIVLNILSLGLFSYLIFTLIFYLTIKNKNENDNESKIEFNLNILMVTGENSGLQKYRVSPCVWVEIQSL